MKTQKAKQSNLETIEIEEDRTFSSFMRPTKTYHKDKPIEIMLVDIDAHTLEVTHTGEQPHEQSEIRIYGVDKHEMTYLLHIQNFLTYFYVQKPTNLELSEDDCEKMVKHLNDYLGGKAVSKVEVVDRVSLTEFRFIEQGFDKFVKVKIYDHSKMSKCRGLFENEYRYKQVSFPRQTYDSNLDYKLRFMIDKGLAGNSWLTVPAHKHSLTKRSSSVSNCTFELDVLEEEIIGHHPSDKAYSVIAPMRILSFDIEVENTVGFPIPERNQVITIGAYCRLHDSKVGEKKVVFQLNTCDKIFDTSLFCFTHERDLLLAFDDFMAAYDPDIILGYNIIAFDLNYLLERRKEFHLEAPAWGRLVGELTTAKKDKFQSKMMGFRELLNINTPGRVQVDMLAHMMREKKLRSYSLNYVCFYFMNEQKEDVSYKIISSLQNESSVTRKRIATYCLKDAILPMNLFDKLKCIYSYVEMARVTGVPLTYLIFKGQQIKIISQLYRATKDKQYIVPYFKKQFRDADDPVKFQGADVLEPKRGYYDVPIATLDFASLYPSIMISHNMCYSTILKGSHERDLCTPEQIHTTTAGYNFVKKEVRKGVLPEILENLLQARKEARQEMAVINQEIATMGENDETFKKRWELENMLAVLDGRQLALKISANSVYGFTGASVGSLPSIEIASSVTAMGREMIDKTKNFVMRNFNRKNGYPTDADVIYGDTDSVMINFGIKDVAEAMRLGRLAAELLSAEYIKPIKLEFEKVYYPYLLLNKKRYAGLLWTKPDKPDKKDMKGVESVRRDNCQLASTMVDKVLDILLIEKNLEKAKAFTKGKVADLLNNNVDISMLIITKGVSRDIEGDAYKVRMPHIELIKRMKLRNNDVKFAVGDRIPFVILCGKINSKNFENSEDPEYAFNNNLPLDLEYYLDKQVRPPLERIFEVICDPKEIFEGEHTRKTKQQYISNKVGMGLFFKPVSQCMNCKKELSKADLEKAICENCKEKEQDIYLKKMVEMKACESDFSRLWSECQRCDGTLLQEVKCNNTDCIIYFKRAKVRKDIQNIYQQISKFD